MAVTQGTMTKAFVSAIDFLDQRDIDPNIYDQSRDRAFTDIMKIVNRYKPATMFNYHNFVNNDVREVGTISAVTSTGVAQSTFTINTAATYPRKGDIIQSSNVNDIGNAALIISDPTFGSGTATITVRSLGGNSIAWFSTVGDTISFATDAFAEKSDAPANRRYGLTKYFNLIQIFREVDEITDIQKVAKIEVEVGGDYHILPYQIIQKKIKLEGDISVAMLTGVQSSTQFGDQNPFLADSVSGLPIQTTGGLNWYCINYGINDQAQTLGTFSFTEIDKMIDNWIANKAPMEQMGFMGSRAYRLISKYLKNLGSSGVTSVRLIIDGKSMDFEVEHLDYGGASLDFIHIPIFDNPQLFSATISPDINGSIFWVPKGSVDTVDNGQQPYLQIRNTPSPFGGGVNGSNNGIMAEWRTGALAETPTSSVAQLHTDFYSAQGLDGLAPKHYQKFRLI